MNCHICGAPQTVTKLAVEKSGEVLNAISHCSKEPSHDVAGPWLEPLRRAILFGPQMIGTVHHDIRHRDGSLCTKDGRCD